MAWFGRRAWGAGLAMVVGLLLAACGGGEPTSTARGGPSLAERGLQVDAARGPAGPAGRERVAAAASGADAAPAAEPAPSGTRTVAVFIGQGAAASPAHLLTLRPDGTGVLVHGPARRDLRWVQAGGDLDVTLAAPIAYDRYDVDPGDGGFYLQREAITQYRYRRIAGSLDRGRVDVRTQSDRLWLEGPSAGATIAGSRLADPGVEMAALKLASRLPIDASELAVGTRWAGLVLPATAEDGTLLLAARGQGSFEITSPTRAWLTPARTSASWSLSYGHLLLRDGGLVQRYTRLEADPLTGQERWLRTLLQQGVEIEAHDGLVVKVDPSARFIAAAVPGDWRSWVNAGWSDDDVRLRLLPDRTGGLFLIGAEEPLQYAIDDWQVRRQGRELAMITDFSAEFGSVNVRTRRWELLRRTGTTMFVLEALWSRNDFGETQLIPWRVNRYTDLGLPPP